MKVIIVRHGQTDENIKKTIAGQAVNSTLNETGVLQAKKLGHHLKNEKIDVAYASDQIRAAHTAEHILEFHPSVTLIKDVNLRERHYGEFEGQPADTAKIAAEQSGLPFEFFRPVGGESHHDVFERIGGFFDGLFKKHKDETVLIVSHGRAISLLLLKILEKPIHKENQELHRPENTGFTVLEIFEGKPAVVHKINSREHLDE